MLSAAVADGRQRLTVAVAALSASHCRRRCTVSVSLSPSLHCQRLSSQQSAVSSVSTVDAMSAPGPIAQCGRSGRRRAMTAAGDPSPAGQSVRSAPDEALLPGEPLQLGRPRTCPLAVRPHLKAMVTRWWDSCRTLVLQCSGEALVLATGVMITQNGMNLPAKLCLVIGVLTKGRCSHTPKMPKMLLTTVMAAMLRTLSATWWRRGESLLRFCSAAVRQSVGPLVYPLLVRV